MKSTVIITNYNKSNYITDCIHSVLNQTKSINQIIIIDNFSNDNSFEKILKFSDKIEIYRKGRVSEIGSENQIDLIKFSIKFIKNEIVHFLDSDDIFANTKISVIENYFKEFKEISVIFDHPLCIYGNKVFKFKSSRLKTERNFWPTIIPTSSISVRKEYLVDLFDKQIFVGFNLLEVDFRINYISRILDKNSLIINKNLNFYRTDTHGIMSKYSNFNLLWWRKRMQAHDFIRKFNTKKIPFSFRSFDFLITKIINELFR